MPGMGGQVRSLRMATRDDLRPPGRSVPRTALTRVGRPSAALARFLYRTVGETWRWRSRLAWTEERWRERLADPAVELWLSWQYGRPTGFAELTTGTGADGRTTYVDYLGLFPDFRGRGLGSRLVWDVTRRAWTAHERRPALPAVGCVTLDTTGDDSAAALPNYERRGFSHALDQADRAAAGTTRRS